MDSAGQIKRLHDVLDASSKSVGRFETELWWRGHAVQDWNLVPSAQRRGLGEDYERNVATRFLAGAPSRYDRCPDQGDLSGWLYLMQHYRLPTRLLDWTESPLIAAYFAVSEHAPETGALWALSPFLLNQNQVGTKSLLTPRHSDAWPLFFPPFRETPPESLKTLAILPHEVDSRMQVQLAAFTLHGSPTPLESLDGSENFLLKFEIPPEFKSVLKDQLFQMGIRMSGLFPDLEHLAKDIAAWTFVPR